MAIALSDRFGITVGVDDLDELTSVEGILGVIEGRSSAFNSN